MKLKAMSTEDRIKATAKNLEGKAEETVGNLTGDSTKEAEGKAKQVEASGMHLVEDVKDQAKSALDAFKNTIDKA
jgi:uncharacterized protein YjbJ (UPF0337 family)